MANGFAIPTGAQFQEDEGMILNFDVLIVDESLEYGNTYFASVVPVESEDQPEELRVKITERIMNDAFNITGLEIQPTSLTIPAYFKGVVSNDFVFPPVVDEEPPEEDLPPEEPPAEDPNEGDPPVPPVEDELPPEEPPTEPPADQPPVEEQP